MRGRPFTNRFCAQPIAGGDATPGGGPGALTRRRYRRLAEGGFGLIWMEGAATGSSGKPQQLCLNRSTWPEFRALVDELRAASGDSRTVLILQLLGGASGGEIVEAAALAAAAGFDGVDLQLPRDLLAPALATIRQTTPQLLLSTRLHVYEAVRGGFGVHRSDYRKPDLTEPARFIAQLRAGGLDLLNLSIASPILTGPDRGLRARRDSETADEHPLTVLQRLLSIAQELRSSVPGLPIVAGGLSWLRQFIPHVAAAALAEGVLDFAGLGRAALAHPFAPAQLFADGALDAGATCILCSACSLLRDEGEQVGCVIRDGGTYGPVYQQMRRFDADRLRAGAARCHLCEAAPCIRASPTRTDIPAFIEAFRKGDEAGAYEIIRRSDPLPELTSRLAPGWLESEGACVETALTGTPVPILDLQYVIAWRARDRAQTGVRLPAVSTGHSIAIVGGGPTGLAAAVRLLEYGHTVHLLEQAHHLGGAPERVIPHTRHPSARRKSRRSCSQRSPLDASICTWAWSSVTPSPSTRYWPSTKPCSSRAASGRSARSAKPAASSAPSPFSKPRPSPSPRGLPCSPAATAPWMPRASPTAAGLASSTSFLAARAPICTGTCPRAGSLRPGFTP